MALVFDRATTNHAVLTEQLQSALTSRVLVEQAKGLLAQLGGLDMDQAFAVLRRYSRDRNERLSDVAGLVVRRELRGQDVLDHAAAKGELRPS